MVATPPIPQPQASTLSPQAVLPAPQRIQFAYGTTVPTSWTSLFTVEQGKRREVTWGTYTATDGTTYTLKQRLLSPTGSSYLLPQAQLGETGASWLAQSDERILIVDAGWSLQHIGSGAGTVNVNYVSQGIEWSLPS